MTSLGVIVGMNMDLAGVTRELNPRAFRTLLFFTFAAMIIYLLTNALSLGARAMAAWLFVY